VDVTEFDEVKFNVTIFDNMRFNATNSQLRVC
jgi:hypothetical protein